jgi:predicted nucleotidyltransferase component of viral defense system
MIQIREIKEKAREFSVPPSTIERDYAQNWLLAHLHPIKMALKGGTGIRKVFIEHYRFSDDLDFTLLEPMDKDTLQAAIQDSVIRVREESGIQFEDDISIKETVSGFRSIARFRIINRSAIAPTNIKLDITPPVSEQILLPLHQKIIYHHFSDHLEASVTSYSLEEIMAEKIRSIFQRTRPRDLYDIWQLSSQVDRDQVKSILNRKCEYKGVVLDISRVLERSDEFKASWDASLRHQMNQIPDFQVAFAGVTESIRRYLG